MNRTMPFLVILVAAALLCGCPKPAEPPVYSTATSSQSVVDPSSGSAERPTAATYTVYWSVGDDVVVFQTDEVNYLGGAASPTAVRFTPTVLVYRPPYFAGWDFEKGDTVVAYGALIVEHER